MEIKLPLLGFLLAQIVFTSELTLKRKRKNDLTKLKHLYSSKLDADVIESYYYDMNECDIHATSDALQEVVKEVEGLEKAQAQTNIDNNLREYSEKLRTDFPMNSISDAIIDGADLIVRVFACPISQVKKKMFEIEHFPTPEENFPMDFKVRYLSASYWKSSKSRTWWTADYWNRPEPLCGIIFSPKSVEIMAGSPNDAMSFTNYSARERAEVLTEQVRKMKLLEPGNYIKRYNRNLQNYINSFTVDHEVKMNKEFCKKYESILNDVERGAIKDSYVSHMFTLPMLCGAIRNRLPLSRQALLKYAATGKEMNEVMIAPNANDVMGFFALPDSFNEKYYKQAVDDSIAMAETFNKKFNKNVKAFRCVDPNCSELAMADKKMCE